MNPEWQTWAVDGLNSNLNLNQGAPARVTPRLGEWGPVDVPTTKQKRRGRWWAVTALTVVLAALIGYGWFIYSIMG